MKANQLATLVLRLMGVYCLIGIVPAISNFSDGILAVVYGSPIYLAVLGGSALAASIVIGILLLACASFWGEKLTLKEAGDEKISSVSFEQVQVLAFAVLGVLIFSSTLPSLITSFFTLLRTLSSANLANTYPNSARGNLSLIETAVGTLLKAVLGLWLFFRADGFAKFWSSLQKFGTPEPPRSQ